MAAYSDTLLTSSGVGSFGSFFFAVAHVGGSTRNFLRS